MKQLLIILCLTASLKAVSQGCVAIRGGNTVCTMPSHDAMEGTPNSKASRFQFNLGYRYFESYKHFRGDHEEKERVENNTQVINFQTTVDLGLQYLINARWSVLVGLPVVSNNRSSLYEHGRTERHSTQSFGIGDMRMMAYAWAIPQNKIHKVNAQLGLGLKLPTGAYNYQDYFYNQGAAKATLLLPVDQSIQPGDGGTGLISEVNAYAMLGKRFTAYTNLYYMANPREVNGTLTNRSNKYEQVMSVSDQYMARVGAAYTLGGKLRHATLSVGGRIEGIPVEDVIGGSLGFRRPGSVTSVEPGLNYMWKKMNFGLTVPVAVYRNRPQSVPDKLTTAESGTFRNGDAAFADYSINAQVSFRF